MSTERCSDFLPAPLIGQLLIGISDLAHESKHSGEGASGSDPLDLLSYLAFLPIYDQVSHASKPRGGTRRVRFGSVQVPEASLRDESGLLLPSDIDDFTAGPGAAAKGSLLLGGSSGAGPHLGDLSWASVQLVDVWALGSQMPSVSQRRDLVAQLERLGMLRLGPSSLAHGHAAPLLASCATALLHRQQEGLPPPELDPVTRSFQISTSLTVSVAQVVGATRLIKAIGEAEDLRLDPIRLPIIVEGGDGRPALYVHDSSAPRFSVRLGQLSPPPFLGFTPLTDLLYRVGVDTAKVVSGLYFAEDDDVEGWSRFFHNTGALTGFVACKAKSFTVDPEGLLDFVDALETRFELVRDVQDSLLGQNIAVAGALPIFEALNGNESQEVAVVLRHPSLGDRLACITVEDFSSHELEALIDALPAHSGSGPLLASLLYALNEAFEGFSGNARGHKSTAAQLVSAPAGSGGDRGQEPAVGGVTPVTLESALTSRIAIHQVSGPVLEFLVPSSLWARLVGTAWIPVWSLQQLGAKASASGRGVALIRPFEALSPIGLRGTGKQQSEAAGSSSLLKGVIAPQLFCPFSLSPELHVALGIPATPTWRHVIFHLRTLKSLAEQMPDPREVIGSATRAFAALAQLTASKGKARRNRIDELYLDTDPLIPIVVQSDTGGPAQLKFVSGSTSFWTLPKPMPEGVTPPPSLTPLSMIYPELGAVFVDAGSPVGAAKYPTVEILTEALEAVSQRAGHCMSMLPVLACIADVADWDFDKVFDAIKRFRLLPIRTSNGDLVSTLPVSFEWLDERLSVAMLPDQEGFESFRPAYLVLPPGDAQTAADGGPGLREEDWDVLRANIMRMSSIKPILLDLSPAFSEGGEVSLGVERAVKGSPAWLTDTTCAFVARLLRTQHHSQKIHDLGRTLKFKNMYGSDKGRDIRLPLLGRQVRLASSLCQLVLSAKLKDHAGSTELLPYPPPVAALAVQSLTVQYYTWSQRPATKDTAYYKDTAFSADPAAGKYGHRVSTCVTLPKRGEQDAVPLLFTDTRFLRQDSKGQALTQATAESVFASTPRLREGLARSIYDILRGTPGTKRLLPELSQMLVLAALEAAGSAIESRSLKPCERFLQSANVWEPSLLRNKDRDVILDQSLEVAELPAPAPRAVGPVVGPFLGSAAGPGGGHLHLNLNPQTLPHTIILDPNGGGARSDMDPRLGAAIAQGLVDVQPGIEPGAYGTATGSGGIQYGFGLFGLEGGGGGGGIGGSDNAGLGGSGEPGTSDQGFLPGMPGTAMAQPSPYEMPSHYNPEPQMPVSGPRPFRFAFRRPMGGSGSGPGLAPSEIKPDSRPDAAIDPAWKDLGFSINKLLEDSNRLESGTLEALSSSIFQGEYAKSGELRVGYFGEMLVWRHLLEQLTADFPAELARGEIALTWVNKDLDQMSTLPYDIVIENRLIMSATYIEVKSTTSLTKPIFDISYNELLMALNEGPNYKLYRVYGVLSDQPSFEKVENLAAHLRDKQADILISLSKSNPEAEAQSGQMGFGSP